MEHSFIYREKVIVYRRYGNCGPVIMMVHGFPEDGAIFEAQYVCLQKTHIVLVLDLPGSGGSEYNAALHTVEDFAALLFAILQEEKVEKCFLLGHSMGGYIALAFAEKYPKRLLGLGLLHSTAYADSEEKKENRRRAILLMENYGGAQFLKSMIPSLFGELYRKRCPEIVDALIVKGMGFETAALQQYYAMMMSRPDRTHVLKQLEVPVLFVIGEKDAAVLPTDVLQQASLPNISFVKILPEAAHMGFLENVEATNNAIVEFASLYNIVG